MGSAAWLSRGRSAARVFVLTTALLPAAAVQARAQNPGAAAGALIEKALATSDIAAPGSPSFRLGARVLLYNTRGNSEAGSLLRIWSPAGLSHDEIELPDYRSVAVSDSRQFSVSRNVDYLPFPIYQMDEALAFPRLLAASHSRELTAPRKAGESGDQCVEAIGKDPQKTLTYCFDSVTGDLRRVISGRWNLTYQFDDYQPFGDKQFPRLVRVLKSSGDPLVELRIDRLVPEERIDFRAFLPVPGARQWPVLAACDGVTDAKLTKMVKPDYPALAEHTGVTGLVRFYIEIGIDGVPRGLWPLNSTSPMLARAAAAAVKQWRYAPQICKANGLAMPMTTDVTLIFTGF